MVYCYSRKLHGVAVLYTSVALDALFHTIVGEIVLALVLLGCWLLAVGCCSWLQSSQPASYCLVSSGCCWELADVDVVLEV